MAEGLLGGTALHRKRQLPAWALMGASRSETGAVTAGCCGPV